MLIKLNNTPVVITLAEIEYSVNGFTLNGWYSAEFQTLGESGSLAIEKFANTADDLTKVVLINKLDGAIIFEKTKDEVSVSTKKSFSVEGVNFPSSLVEVKVCFSRKITSGEYILCQFHKPRTTPLKVSLHIENAELENCATFTPGSSHYTGVARGNSFSFSVCNCVETESPEDKVLPNTEESTPNESTDETKNTSKQEEGSVASNTAETLDNNSAKADETCEESEDPTPTEKDSDEKNETPAPVEEATVATSEVEVENTKEIAKEKENETPAPVEEVPVNTTEEVENSQDQIPEGDQEKQNETTEQREIPEGTEVPEEESDEEDGEYEEDDEYEEGEEYEEESEEEEYERNLTYSAEELLKYRNLDDCQKEPEDLINSTIPILKKNNQSRGNNQQGQRKGQRKGHRGNKKPKRGNRHRKEQDNRPKLDVIKPLEKSENRFIPKILASGSSEESEAEKILKNVNRNLNKLAKENFESLSKKIVDVLIDDEEVLNGVVEKIYDKALEQPKFVDVYTELCLFIQRSDTAYKNQFIVKLADKAKQVFQTITNANIGEKADYTEEERNYLIKLRYLGNIELICRLYKKRLLVPGVPLRCARNLLRQTNDFITEEDSLEALCKMLQSLGPLLHSTSPAALTAIIGEIRSTKESRKDAISSRIRFMLEDILTFSANNWRVPHPDSRRSSTKAKSFSPSAGNVKNSPNRGRTGSPAWGRSSTSNALAGGKPRKNIWGRKSEGNIETANITKAPKTEPINSPTPKKAEPKKEIAHKLDEQKAANSIKNLLDEYSSLKDEEEAKECVLELKAPESYLPVLVRQILAYIKKEQQVPLLEKLLRYLHKEKVITAENLKDGFDLIFESIIDDAEEFPNFPKFIGKVFGGFVKEGIFELKSLKSIFTVEDKTIILRFTGAVFDRVFEGEEEPKIKEELQKADLSMEDITKGIPTSRLQRYITNEKVLSAIKPPE